MSQLDSSHCSSGFHYRNYLSQEDQAVYYHWIEELHSILDHQVSSPKRFLDIVASIPTAGDNSYLAMSLFSIFLDKYNGPRSVFDILRCYTKLWTSLPEVAKAGSTGDQTGFLEQVQQQVMTSVGSLLSLFPTLGTVALTDPESKYSLTHQQLSIFIRHFRLPFDIEHLKKKPVVILALPNGYLLGLACLAVSSYYTAASLSISGGPQQFKHESDLIRPKAIMVMESDIDKLGLRQPWVAAANIDVFVVEPNSELTFEVRPLNNSTSLRLSLPHAPNSGDDFALILLTSGTSGKKKVVPVTSFSLMIGICCVIDSWGLSSRDTCLNMMPLNHVGGIVRNLFAPVLSGGTTILCPVFDPNLFWDIIEDGRGTWYYAAPSMHTSILAEGAVRPEAVKRSQLRLVCNAAGGLLPALAGALKDTFKCTVLPSYGMTECMPISTPPLSYTLDRSGTSGLSCGPEIEIKDNGGQVLGANEIGHICVRGGPTFGGYLHEDKIVRDTFLEGGWFDTGDLGYLDGDGYLFLTGRGKEVINRGGELISPFEVEEAITLALRTSDSPLYGRVKEVLAFSAPHEILQEVVGVVLVTHLGKTRPDLRELQEALKASLHPSKLPVVIVYMDALPTNNNKIVRVNLGERFGFDPIRNDMKLIERHFEAVCPPTNSTLDTKIKMSSCLRDSKVILTKLEENLDPEFEAFVKDELHDGLSEVFVAPRTTVTPMPSVSNLRDSLYDILRRDLDGYLIPSKITYIETPFPKQDVGLVDWKELSRLLQTKASESTLSASEMDQKIRQAIAEVLKYPVEEISSETDFFEIGGDSLNAGRLLSILRRDLQIRIAVDQLFTSSKVKDLSMLADKLLASQDKIPDPRLANNNSSIVSGKTYSSTNPILLIIHLLPIIFFYPIKIAFQWVVLIYGLTTLAKYWKNSHFAARYLSLIAAMTMSRVVVQIVAPLFGIVFKWVVIGRYKEGIYPMWGFYHTRWWLVQKVLRICGQGVFKHTDWTRLTYYRLLGAKIGKNVTIEAETILGEYDLIDIGDNVHLDRCICRPFACERNASMFLGRIVVGKNSIVGLKTYIAAGSVLPEDTFIGPNSSSWETNIPMEDNRDIGRGKATRAHILLRIMVIFPIQTLVLFISSLPWLAGLFGVVTSKPTKMSDGVKTIITWWASPHRILFHYLAVALHVSVGPIVWFGAVVSIKMIVDKAIGKARAFPADQRTQKDNFRRSLLDALVPNGDLGRITKLFGTHYEFTSFAVRRMGGKVGRNVYWPGNGPSIQDFDLIDIGNDVVFGSRSHIVTSDGRGCAPVRVQHGAMIADRVILSPGTTVGNHAVLGTGTFTKRNQTCASGTVWIGNKNGGAVCLTKQTISKEKAKSDESLAAKFTSEPQLNLPFSSKSSVATTKNDFSDIPGTSGKGESISSPFGRAFYEGQAPYFIFGQTFIFFYSVTITIFVQIYWNLGPILTIALSNIIKHSSLFSPTPQRPLIIYSFAAALLSAITTLLTLIAAITTIAAKWALLGQRKPGAYDWDKSSYCQRWQLFLTIEVIRTRCFGGYGIIEMITGTHYAVLYFRAMGAKIGKDCALFAGGRPSLILTEPDLLELGDRVAMDDASLVSHINSRGNFELNRLSVGSRSVLRSGSRLLSGAQMGEDACLLEHTLIMAGDVADDGTTYQGWPADVFYGNRVKLD